MTTEPNAYEIPRTIELTDEDIECLTALHKYYRVERGYDSVTTATILSDAIRGAYDLAAADGDWDDN